MTHRVRYIRPTLALFVYKKITYFCLLTPMVNQNYDLWVLSLQLWYIQLCTNTYKVLA
jgi:hypothetical protein